VTAPWPAHGAPAWDTALYAYVSGPGQNPVTGMYHAETYGDLTMKTSNVNLAIAAAKASGSGGVIYMKTGEWTCDEPINMSATGEFIKLLGAGNTLTRVKITGTVTYGFLEVVGSTKAHIEGIGFTMDGTGLAQYGILGGRDTTDGSFNYLKLKDVYVFGRFTVAAGVFVSLEEAHYEDCIFYSNQGAGLALARDTRNWAVTARWTAVTTTSGLTSGNGVIHVDRLTCITQRNATAGPNDVPLTVEYAQTFTADSVYTNSGGAPLIVLDKRIDQASFRGLHQEWSSGIAGATEPYGIYLKGTVTGTELRQNRLRVEASAIYAIFGEDNVSVNDLNVSQTAWRGSTRAFQIDVWGATTIRAPQAGLDYFPISAQEVTTPAYRRRNGNPLVVDTPHMILRAAATINPGSIAVNGAADATVTVTGAVVGDDATVHYSDGTSPPVGVAMMAWVSAANTVTVRWVNCTSITVDPASVTLHVNVFKFA
jgi:hypothetical protein